MDFGILITIAVAIVVSVVICLFAVKQGHKRLEAKLDRPKKAAGDKGDP